MPRQPMPRQVRLCSASYQRVAAIVQVLALAVVQLAEAAVQIEATDELDLVEVAVILGRACRSILIP